MSRQSLHLLDLVLRVAASEAVAGGFGEITTAHLLMALCRLSEEQALGVASREVEGLRQELREFGIEPTPFRRRLRTLLGRREPAVELPDVLHRSERCKAVFACAAAAGREGDEAHAPASHLLRAALGALADLEPEAQGREAGAVEIPWEI